LVKHSESLGENGDNVEIILNDGNRLTERGNGNSSKKSLRGKKSNKRGRKSSDADRNAQVTREKAGLLGTIFNVWNVLTFSWIRPLMVTGAENIRLCLLVATFDTMTPANSSTVTNSLRSAYRCMKPIDSDNV
jgi:hypothetical protein